MCPLLPAEPSPADTPGDHYGRPSASTPVHPILFTFAEIMKNCFKGLSLCVVLIQYTHIVLGRQAFFAAPYPSRAYPLVEAAHPPH